MPKDRGQPSRDKYPLPASVDFGRAICGNLAAAESREWLVTNGLGGFASGTVAGSLTRRYHGLLVAALHPPIGRTLLVTKVEERAAYDGVTYELATNRWRDGFVDPSGYVEIERFRLDGTTPVWTFAIGDALLEKRIWMEDGVNRTFVQYALVRASGEFDLQLDVLANYRDFHATTEAGDWRMQVDAHERRVRVQAFPGAVPIVIAADRGNVVATHEWYRNFVLRRETERGLPDNDDNLHVAGIRVTLALGDTVTLTLQSGDDPGPEADAAYDAHVERQTVRLRAARKASPKPKDVPEWIDQLVLAADQFVVRRPIAGEPGARSIIAGYPWFGDWGRDTMIGLPGIALATGRPELAANILTTFGRFVDGGMVPNFFPDGGHPPAYNSVDAALWYIEAVRQYVAATGDRELLGRLFEPLAGIIDAYEAGTRYHIAVDPADGLVSAGEGGVQLTWMDAKVGDWVVTPRAGKPVEISALWYNALCAMAGFAAQLKRDPTPYAERAARTRAGFGRFWNAELGYCYDVIDGPAGNDPALRPNQLLAVSLAASPLSADRQRAVVNVCGRRLLTSFGLRSLDAADPAYCGTYGGSVASRDGAYHQGTVWGWLIGPWVDAYRRTGGDPAVCATFLEPFARALTAYGLGTAGEIFNGDAPHEPNGCIAQAWTVAEILRAWRAIEPE